MWDEEDLFFLMGNQTKETSWVLSVGFKKSLRSGMTQTKVLLLHKYWWKNQVRTVSENIYAFFVFRPACSLLQYPFNFSFCFITTGVIMSLAVTGLFHPVLRLIVMSMTVIFVSMGMRKEKKRGKKACKSKGDPNTEKVKKNAIYCDKTQHVNFQGEPLFHSTKQQ